MPWWCLASSMCYTKHGGGIMQGPRAQMKSNACLLAHVQYFPIPRYAVFVNVVLMCKINLRQHVLLVLSAALPCGIHLVISTHIPSILWSCT